MEFDKWMKYIQINAQKIWSNKTQHVDRYNDTWNIEEENETSKTIIYKYSMFLRIKQTYF